MTSTRLVLGCIGLGAFLAATACGGSSGIDLFSNGDAGAGEGGAGSSSGSSGTSGTNGDGGGGGREGGTSSGAPQPGGDTTTIPCGTGSCNLATEVCCLTSAGTGGTSTGTFACTAGSTCPAPPGGGGGGDNPSVALKCTGAANCGPGTVCCVTRTDTAVTASCAASCTADQAQLCDPTAATTGCSPSLPCSSDNIREWRLPRTFATCGGKGD